MRKRIPALAALVVVLVLTAACAEPPEERVLQAEQELQAARDAEAATYAAAELRDAGLALEEAQQEIQAQNERFAIMRDYEEAENKLAASMEKARLTRETAVERKEEARLAAVESLALAGQAVEEATTALGNAPRGKGTKADILALTADLDGVRSQFPALEAQIDQEDYFAARDKAASITESAQAIAGEIKAAVEMEARILAKRRNR
jgi:hypothetical protein